MTFINYLKNYRLVYANGAQRSLAKMHRDDIEAIKDRLDQLIKGVQGLDVKKLQGVCDQYRLRVGKYRVIFIVDKGNLVVLVVEVDHRKNVYH